MAAVRILLLAACAWAASAGPVGQACSSTQTGTLIGAPIPLQTALQPGIRDWKVHIPDLPQCPYGPAGVFASVCDSDIAPAANFLSSKVIQVHRHGNLLSFGTVDVKVYCGTSQQQQSQPLLHLHHQHSPNHQHGQTHQNVAELCHNVAKLCAQPTVPSVQSPSQPALKVFSLHPGHLSLPSLGRQLPFIDHRSHSQYSSLEHLSLPSLKVSELDHSHNPLRFTHQPLLGQSALPNLSVTSVSKTRSSLPSLQVSSVSQGHSSLQSLGVSPVSHSSLHSLSGAQGRSSVPSLSASPVSQGQSSQTSVSSSVSSGHSPLPSLRVTASDPLSHEDQPYNPLLTHSPQQLSLLGQSSVPLLQLRDAHQLVSSKPPPYVGQWPQ